MNLATRSIRCDRRYLSVRLGAQLFFLALVACADLIFLRISAIALLAASFAVLATLGWLARKKWKFTVDPNHIRTEKSLTNQIDLCTPLDQVIGVSTYEGILEALLGVGTIEISTASSQQDHATIKWPHVRNARSVAAGLEDLLKEKRSSTE